jgi:putative endonuclease
MSSSSKRQKGEEGEDIAVSYLEAKDYIVMDRNYFFEQAEVDLVAHDGREIVFVEVKLRSSKAFGAPEDAITGAKINSVRKAAEAWVYERKMDGYPVRFDVIAILYDGKSAPEITHFEDAFQF